MRCVLWTGSRGWEDVDAVIGAVTSLRKPFRSIVGDAQGFDSIVWEVLAEFGLPRWRYFAYWQSLGRGAGHVRNDLMLRTLSSLDSSGFLIAGWDGVSPGTKSMIDKAEKKGVDVWKIR